MLKVLRICNNRNNYLLGKYTQIVKSICCNFLEYKKRKQNKKGGGNQGGCHMERKEENNLEEKKNVDLSLGAIAQNWIQSFLKQVAERLEKMEEVLVVDRIEGDIAICENRKTKKMQSIHIADLPRNVEEGNILKWQDGKYEIDTSKEIENRIEQKMKDVWK